MAKSGRALHILTTASLSTIQSHYPGGDFDVRRFRPNLVFQTSETDGFPEEGWGSHTLAVGPDLRIRVERPNKRCVVTTMRQGTLPADDRILKTITVRNQSNLGVMCTVVSGGRVRVGDLVRPH